jgi:hypothetical protein
MRRAGAIALVVLTGLLIWAVQYAPSKTVLHLRLTKTISINNPYPMTFIPPPTLKRPTISAAEAYDRYLTDAHGFGITSPSGPNAVVLGVLSVRNQDGSFMRNDELTWGYAWTSWCSNIPGHLAPNQAIPRPPYPPPSPCTYWIFRDAHTGRRDDGPGGNTHSLGWLPGLSPT